MPSSVSLRERLRSATHALHEALERDVGIDDRIRTKSGYVSHLVQLWRLHASIEAELRLVDFAPVGFAYPHPYRAALLEADLATLGISDATLAALPLPPAPRLASIGAALGCVYVVEGSAKGARAILPAIESTLGIDAGSGASFFAGCGAGTGRLWRAALTAMNEIPRA
jgi:heme oxygenase